ncbi:MAG: ATP-binding cassette domain-containing protein [Acidobacteriota bacterium]
MNIIQTHGLTKSFADVIAVDRLDMAIPRGVVSAFLGPNGAGKTTTLRLLLGLTRPDRGRVELFGGSPAASAFTRIGALIETPSLYDHLSGRENLMATRVLLGCTRADEDRVIEQVGLTAAADRRVAGYSLGMRQRLGLATALLGEPELLILDEPTNGLDPAGIQDIRNLLRRLTREHGISVLISSHLLAEVEQVADHVVVLHRGRCLFQGPREALHRAGRARIGVDRPEEAAAWLEANEWSVEPAEAGTLWVIADTQSRRAALCHRLIEAGFAVDRLEPEVSSLESVFFNLTGFFDLTESSKNEETA